MSTEDLREQVARLSLTAQYEHRWTHWDNLGQYRQQGFCVCQEFAHVVDGHDYESISGELAMERHRADSLLPLFAARERAAAEKQIEVDAAFIEYAATGYNRKGNNHRMLKATAAAIRAQLEGDGS